MSYIPRFGKKLKGNRGRGPQGFDHTKAKTSTRGKESGKGEIFAIYPIYKAKCKIPTN